LILPLPLEVVVPLGPQVLLCVLCGELLTLW
jgi:hypothetical protein